MLNSNVDWRSSNINIPIPALLRSCLLFVNTAVALIIYRYLKYLDFRCRTLLEFTFGFLIAATVSALFDTIFWGGTWDYINIFHRRVYDLKDFYLFAAFGMILVYVTTAAIEFKSMAADERNRLSFIKWIMQKIKT